MPNPIFLQRSNAYMNVDKLGRHLYRISNTTLPGDYISIRVSVVRTDGGEDVAILDTTLAAGESKDLNIMYVERTDFGGDGVYRICCTPTQTIYTRVPTPINGNNFTHTFVEIPNVNSGTSISSIENNGTVIYDSALHGPADFSNPSLSLANAVQAILDYIATFPGGNSGRAAVFIAPNTASPIVGDTPSPNWRLLVFTVTPPVDATVRTAFTELTVNTSTGVGVATGSVCRLAFPDFNLPQGVEYIDQLFINNTNILTRPYNVVTELPALTAAITNHLDSLGDVTYYPASSIVPNAFWEVSPCAIFNTFTLAAMSQTVLPTECITVYALDDTYDCYNKTMRALLCIPGCCNGCASDALRKELREKSLQIQALLVGAILRTMTVEDALNPMGLEFTGQQPINSLFIDDYFPKLRSFVFKCGYGCEEKKPCGC